MVLADRTLPRGTAERWNRRTESPLANRRGARDRQLVLLVDDDPHDREIYGTILCYNGFDVVCASAGRAGLEMAEQHAPDVVVLDLGLPDLHGLDICQTLRGRTDTMSIPVIALSAFPEQQMGMPARKAGCTRYIEKPASPVAVLHEIEELVGKAPLPGDGRPPHMTNAA